MLYLKLDSLWRLGESGRYLLRKSDVGITPAFYDSHLASQVQPARFRQWLSDRCCEIELCDGSIATGYCVGPRKHLPGFLAGESIVCRVHLNGFGYYGITSCGESVNNKPLPSSELDGNRLDSFADLMREIETLTRHGLGIGQRLISLDDALVGGQIESFQYAESIRVTWLNSDRTRAIFDHNALATVLEYELQLWHEPDAKQQVMTELGNARAGRGPTLFEAVLDVFGGNVHVDLVLA